MKTLKEELQEIVDKKKLKNNFGANGIFICVHLSKYNANEIKKYRIMSRNYAKKHVLSGGDAWWNVCMSKNHLPQLSKEKYRFIKDLIAIL